MLLAKPFEPAAGGVPLAVVLGLTVLLDDRLGCQRDDFLEVGMDQGGPQQLMGIGELPLRWCFSRQEEQWILEEEK